MIKSSKQIAIEFLQQYGDFKDYPCVSLDECYIEKAIDIALADQKAKMISKIPKIIGIPCMEVRFTEWEKLKKEFEELK